MADINVTPLVDVMLVLLVVFMITAPMLATGVAVTLPKTAAEQLKQENERPLVVTLLVYAFDPSVRGAFLDGERAVDKRRKIGTQGYCMTGLFTVRSAAAVPGRIGAAASFHGGNMATDEATSAHLLASRITAKVLVAGAVEESSKGQGSIAAGAPLMLFIMFTLLMLQLHSFSRAVLVFLTGPMGIAGVAAALLLLNRPFGFVALLGVIALMGMIMRNSVILIDQIEHDRERGVATWDAIVEAAVRRFRPIILTAAAAVLAMIPLSRSVFWGPMAVAIMGGLIVATVLTLLALPAMYAAWFRVRRPAPA